MNLRTSLGVVVGLALVVAPSAADDPPTRKSRIDMPTLVKLHNAARAKANRGPLKANDKLTAAARAHAKDMGDHDLMSHEGTDGSTSVERVHAQGYKFQTLGENVAMGQKSSEEVMRAWMDSPHHKENILKPEFTEIGVACYVSDDGVQYWCAVFGKPWPTVEPAKDATALLDALNAARAEAKASPLKIEPKLAASAQTHAGAMAEAGKFLPKDPDGKTPTERAQREGYNAAKIAQNDAIGQGDPAKVVSRWLEAKDGSREIILGSGYADAGIGVASDKQGVPYWCLILAQPRAARR